jgi:dCTP deaminase
MPGVLTRPTLLDELQQQNIRFDPPINNSTQIGPCSIDLRVGYRFQRPRATGAIDTVPFTAQFLNDTSVWEIFEDEKTFTIEPGKFVVGFAFETLIVANHLMAFVEARSPFARPGLSVHVDPTVDPGFAGRLVLRFYNNSQHNRVISAEERIAQLIFVYLDRPIEG